MRHAISSKGIRRFFPAALVLLLLLVIISGCNKKEEIKPSEDSVITVNALDRIERIRTAYESRNITAVAQHTEPALLKDMENELFFDSAHLLFPTPRLVRITENQVRVLQNWQGEWVLRGKTIKNRGVSTFVFAKDTMMLMKIEGDNPFFIPVVRQ